MVSQPLWWKLSIMGVSPSCSQLRSIDPSFSGGVVLLWDPALHVQFGSRSGTKQKKWQKLFSPKAEGRAHGDFGCPKWDAVQEARCWQGTAPSLLLPAAFPRGRGRMHGQERGAGARAGVLAAEEELWRGLTSVSPKPARHLHRRLRWLWLSDRVFTSVSGWSVHHKRAMWARLYVSDGSWKPKVFSGNQETELKLLWSFDYRFCP